MQVSRFLAVLLGFVSGALVVVATRTGEVQARAERGACAQWQIVTGVATVPIDKPMNYGDLLVSNAPAGFEPFAAGEHGQLFYRRCAP